jgi:CBS domain-containing protein
VEEEMEPRVRDAMSTSDVQFDEGHLLADALDEMQRRGVGTAPVVSADGSLKGVLVRRDAGKALRRSGAGSSTVGEACRGGVSVGVDDSLQAALRVLEAEEVGQIPVVDGGRPVGAIAMSEIRSHLKEQMKGMQPNERSRAVWRGARPRKGLTWGKELSGEAFIDKAEAHGAFAADKAVLEIGPGYGRLLHECLRRGVPFRSYMGVDISPANAAHLTKEFDRPDFDVIVGDVETAELQGPFDVVLSSLTLKHLYPSFEAALRNVERHLNPGATVIFDLIESEPRQFFPADGPVYVRWYSRAEVEEILSRVGLELVTFDDVEHDPEYVRLLVVARKPAAA